MKIRTQFIITTAVFVVILAIIAAMLVITQRQIAQLDEQEDIAVNIERAASELGFLSNDYLLFHESQQRIRWESKFASFSSDLAKLNPVTPELQAMVSDIRANQQRLKAVFSDVMSAFESTPPGAAVDQAIVRVSWSRMAVQNQGMFFDILRLARAVHEEQDRKRQMNDLLIFTFIGVFGAFIAFTYALNYRRALKSILELQSGIRIIGSGNLDYVIKERRPDEFGELSRAFNRMTADLKSVTASKADLEREIAERQKAEEVLEQRTLELEAANKELEAFSYSVSHDLRAPLRSMDGFSQALLDDCGDSLSEEGKGYLRRIQGASMLMGQLIDDLLKISRATRQEMRLNDVDLSELAGAVVEGLKQCEPDRCVDVTIAPDVTSRGDVRLLRLVFENLFGNAWKFTGKMARAKIEFGFMRQDGKQVYFIRDNGAGFDMRYAAKLFQPFQRLHSSSEFTGTGIGLATVQRIIRRHGGQVWAEGAVEKGATFFFTLDCLVEGISVMIDGNSNLSPAIPIKTRYDLPAYRSKFAV